jgi:hypothetical protein
MKKIIRLTESDLIRIVNKIINESDPKVGTGKKPEGSDRRLYTDENPSDTVSVKFKTKQDIVDTLNKESFKSKSHARQSQIINLIHQRLRVALERAKDPEVKKRLRTAFEYIVSKKEESKRKTQDMKEGLDINRIKEVMGLNEVFDDIIGIPLYHKTSTSRGLDIINSDALRAGSLPSGDYLSYDKRLARTKHQNAISFTRDKNWDPGHTIGIGLESPLEDSNMTFVADRNKLRTKYKVESFNYAGIEPDYEHHSKNDELEERVMTNEIYPLHRYLIDIIYTGDNPEVQQQIDEYLNRR